MLTWKHDSSTRSAGTVRPSHGDGPRSGDLQVARETIHATRICSEIIGYAAEDRRETYPF
jgi:hypothetical protein